MTDLGARWLIAVIALTVAFIAIGLAVTIPNMDSRLDRLEHPTTTVGQ